LCHVPFPNRIRPPPHPPAHPSHCASPPFDECPGLGVGAAFTAGALAGACAGETAKAAACECNFLAYCIHTGLRDGLIEAPEGTGTEILHPARIPDIQLWDTCKRLMTEEKMAAEYALIKAKHDLIVVKIVSIAVSLGAGGGDMGGEVCLEIPGVPDFADVLEEIKGYIEDGEEIRDAAMTDQEMCRAFISKAMQRRQARA